MFSWFHSLISGKENHHHHRGQTVDDSAIISTSTGEDDIVVVNQRRHSDDSNIKHELYPKLDPSGVTLPYGVSPALHDSRPNSITPTTKEGTAVNFLHGVPFELASYIDIMSSENREKLSKFLQKTKDALTDDMISEGYNYDFHLEKMVLSEFHT